MEDNDYLSGKNRDIIAALLTSPSHSVAAEKANVSLSTIRRRMRNEEFRKHFDRERKTVYEHTMAFIQTQAGEAAQVLVDIMKSGIVESARVAACREILSCCFRWQEMADIEERLSAIENTLEVRR